MKINKYDLYIPIITSLLIISCIYINFNTFLIILQNLDKFQINGKANHEHTKIYLYLQIFIYL